MTDWLILVAFAIAWLAGWCSRWQFDRRNWERDDEEEPFERWPQYKLVHEPPPLAKPGQVRKMLGQDK